MTVLRTKKRRSYGREPDVEVYGGVKMPEAESYAEGVDKRRKQPSMQKTAKNLKKGQGERWKGGGWD